MGDGADILGSMSGRRSGPLDARASSRVTSGAFGFRLNKILALALLTPDAAQGDLSVLILGRALAARELHDVPYDPENRRPRGLDEAAQVLAAE